MDSERFDGLARSVSQVRSRRQALRSLAGVAAGGALALGGRGASADLCKRNGKACKKDGQCCSKKCIDGTCQPNPQGTCAAGEDICTEGDPTPDHDCNPTPVLGDACYCFTTAEDKATVCVNHRSTSCDVLNCVRNDDCASLGAGYVCIAGTAASPCGACRIGVSPNFCGRLCTV